MNKKIWLILLIGVLLISGCSGGGGGNGSNDDSENNGDNAGDYISGGVLQPSLTDDTQIIFLHHSTGGCIWGGGVSNWFTNYNIANNKQYNITERAYPKSTPYGWNNYPYDYWNIWVNHEGNVRYEEEDTLELLSRDYQVIIWKHCFPVSNIGLDKGNPNISSSTKTIENYQLQYNALKDKMHDFPNVRFILWTGAALVKGGTTPENAERARRFFSWVKDTWDEPGDNIYIWDFYKLETDGGSYMKNEYASNLSDSHPNGTFSATVAPYFCHRIIDVIQGRGDIHSRTGKDMTY